ncbi:MAG: prepilin-type N-terminal cleavage/methylation domain-containing protein [Syntrophales bacterium]
MNSIHSIINRITIRHSCESRNPEKYWIPPYQVRGKLSQARNDKAGNPVSPSSSREDGWVGAKGFTLIEIIVVIVILSIASVITIKFLVDSLRIYNMTVNQKTLFDEGKLALERMCRDIRDANAISGSTASSITFVRDNATAQDSASETITFRWLGGTNPLEKVKAGTGYPMASNVTAFAVANATNEILLTLTLSRTSGENVTLQTKVYPKNLPKDATYKNFCQNWMEVYQ